MGQPSRRYELVGFMKTRGSVGTGTFLAFTAHLHTGYTQVLSIVSASNIILSFYM